MLPANVRIIQILNKVRVECPHCNIDIEMSYHEFADIMPSDYPGDWGGYTINCQRCEKEIEIDDIEWH